MLSMDKYPQEYIDECRANVDAAVSAYENLATTAKAQHDAPLDAALESFEPFFYNNMVVVLEGYFVHRARAIERKDGNPLNEVRVRTHERDQQTVLELEVDPADLGKVIGRQGRTARAMRTLLAAAGQKTRRRYSLDILD